MKTRGVVFESEMPMVEPGAATLYDMSRYRSHGAITGAVWVRLPSGLWVLDYDSGIPSYVTIPAAACPQLNFTAGDFSIVARIYIDSLAITRRIFIRGLRNTDGYEFYVHSAGHLTIITNQAAAFQYSETAAGVITAGTWHTVGLSRTGASIRPFHNGVDVSGTAGVHIDPTTSARSAKIGIGDNLAEYPMDGRIPLVRFFNYALSPGQHLQMHEALKRWV